MRLWSLHPKYLDGKGLTAAWREGLLAQAVLGGKTTGYRNHPQLERFKTQPDPPGAVAAYLAGILEEARRRGYRFDAGKVGEIRLDGKIPVTRGQMLYEWESLRSRLARRDPRWLRSLPEVDLPEPHPIFTVVDGGIEPWERPKIG